MDNVNPNRKTAPLLDLSNDTFDRPKGTNLQYNCAMWVGGQEHIAFQANAQMYMNQLFQEINLSDLKSDNLIYNYIRPLN